MNQHNKNLAFQSKAVPVFQIKCALCGKVKTGDTPGEAADKCIEDEWEITNYNPKKHVKIMGYTKGDILATCFSHSDFAIWL